MKTKARLIYKSVNTCFQTSLPVYFYGLSNGKMVILVAISKTGYPEDNTLRWLLADHHDFTYDFDSGDILTNGFQKVEFDEFMELADNLEQRIIPVATFGNFSTANEAQHYLNINAYNMLVSQNQEHLELCYY